MQFNIAFRYMRQGTTQLGPLSSNCNMPELRKLVHTCLSNFTLSVIIKLAPKARANLRSAFFCRNRSMTILACCLPARLFEA